MHNSTGTYCYIVVTVSGHKCFINKDMDYSDNFDDVLKFCSKDDARDFIAKQNLSDKNPQIINYIN